MSYILDALRKSEQQRKLVRDLKLEQDTGPQAPPPTPRLWPLALVTALAIGIAVAAYFAWRSETTPAPKATSTSPLATELPAPTSTGAERVITSDQSSAAISDLARQTQIAKPTAAVPTTTTDAQTPPAEIPFLREMPSDFLSSVPPLTVNIHVYSPDPTQRVLYINNKAVREGEAVADKIYVERIVADGVVLQRLGTRFKLPRPQ